MAVGSDLIRIAVEGGAEQQDMPDQPVPETLPAATIADTRGEQVAPAYSPGGAVQDTRAGPVDIEDNQSVAVNAPNRFAGRTRFHR